MAGLSVLPTRALANPEAEKMAYQMALDGVTKHGLDTAVKNIMAGSLGHGWMPSPPELRIQIDEVMRPIKEARARDQKERRILEDQAKDRRRRGMTPEQRQRATEKWQSARAAMKMQTEEENAYEAAISRLQAASETNGNDFNLDRITNAKTGPFKQVGRAQ
ncbi:MAG: hypothetical protein ACTHLK_22355 [Brucella intermedia]